MHGGDLGAIWQIRGQFGILPVFQFANLPPLLSAPELPLAGEICAQLASQLRNGHAWLSRCVCVQYTMRSTSNRETSDENDAAHTSVVHGHTGDRLVELKNLASIYIALQRMFGKVKDVASSTPGKTIVKIVLTFSTRSSTKTWGKTKQS